MVQSRNCKNTTIVNSISQYISISCTCYVCTCMTSCVVCKMKSCRNSFKYVSTSIRGDENNFSFAFTERWYTICSYVFDCFFDWFPYVLFCFLKWKMSSFSYFFTFFFVFFLQKNRLLIQRKQFVFSIKYRENVRGKYHVFYTFLLVSRSKIEKRTSAK